MLKVDPTSDQRGSVMQNKLVVANDADAFHAVDGDVGVARHVTGPEEDEDEGIAGIDGECVKQSVNNNCRNT